MVQCHSYFSQEPFGGQDNYALGVTAGVGGGGSFTNATCAEDLTGVSKTYSFNIWNHSFQYGTGNGIFIASWVFMLTKITGKYPSLKGRGFGDVSGYATDAIGKNFWSQK
jgi:hypothetical protein